MEREYASERHRDIESTVPRISPETPEEVPGAVGQGLTEKPEGAAGVEHARPAGGDAVEAARGGAQADPGVPTWTVPTATALRAYRGAGCRQRAGSRAGDTTAPLN